MNPWAQAYPHHAIDLLEPDYSQVSFAHLAHACSQISRFAGNTKIGPYSVAQHSILVMSGLASQSDMIMLFGLLHDLHEAVTGDISSPVKRALKKLAHGRDVVGTLEDIHQRAIFKRFAGRQPTDQEMSAVAEADLRALMTEQRDLVGDQVRPWEIDADPYPWKIAPWVVGKSYTEFVGAWDRLRAPNILA